MTLQQPHRRQRRHARWVVVGTALTAVMALGPLPAQASLFGEENATLVAILTEEITGVAKAAEQVSQLIETVTRLKRMVQQGDTLLSAATGFSFDEVLGSLQTARDIASDIKLIGYDLGRVDSEREQVYRASLEGVRTADFHTHYIKWNQQLAEASNVAMRAQTNLSQLERRNEALQKIQSSSDATEGVVGQLQLVVSAIGLLHADLEALQRSVDTGMRVTSAAAAGQASAAHMRDEESTRMLDNYTYHGRSVVVPNELP